MNSASRTAKSILCCAALLFLVACSETDELAQRQQEVAEAGAAVMPFDLDATTHIFTATDNGGIQEVVADDASDTDNIALIELHLADEAAKFQSGDFSDPEAIHGSAMPGLAVLQERFDEVDVALLPHQAGATLTYTAADPDVIGAIHAWFDAQVADHGSHAEHADE